MNPYREQNSNDSNEHKKVSHCQEHQEQLQWKHVHVEEVKLKLEEEC